MNSVENRIKEVSTVTSSDMSELYASCMAPALSGFVAWTLEAALQKEIHRLYFLARDGYLMYRIAKIFCAKYELPIDCRYIYCSRNAWRIPSYHLIGEEAFSLIFGGGYSVTPDILLGRIGISGEIADSIYASIEFPVSSREVQLNPIQLEDFAEKACTSALLNQILDETSRAAYADTMGYLRQCGMLDGVPFALVDTGWTGSMQRTLNQLLTSANLTDKPNISGFYFGMYDVPEQGAENYFTYYFSKRTHFINKLKFNNNLFEALSVAPHPMTVGYKLDNGRYNPVFKGDASTSQDITSVEDTVCSFANSLVETHSFEQIAGNDFRLNAAKALRRVMCNPTENEIELLNTVMFSDDVAEGYQSSLIDALSSKDIPRVSFMHRLFRKLGVGKSTGRVDSDLFWSYGSIAASKLRCKWWLKLNVLTWDWVKFMIKR